MVLRSDPAVVAGLRLVLVSDPVTVTSSSAIQYPASPPPERSSAPPVHVIVGSVLVHVSVSARPVMSRLLAFVGGTI